MNSSLERRLAAVIEDELRDLPQPPPGLFDTITRGAVRRRRRRRRLATICGATAAALAVAGLLALVPALNPGPGPNTVAPPSVERSAPTPSAATPSAATASGPATPTRVPELVPPTSADRMPDFGAAKPIEHVWPQAIVRLPNTVDGRYLRPSAILPNNRYVVGSSVGAQAFLAVYDATTRKLASIANTVGPAGGEVIGIAGDRVVTVFPGVSSPQEIWSVRLDGGGTTLLARPQAPLDAKVNIVSITRDSVVWSLIVNETSRTRSDGSSAGAFPWEGRFIGLYRVPVTGGQVEQIPGGNGFTTSWHIPGVVNTTHTWDTGPQTGQIWDLTTGERSGYTRNQRMAEMVCTTLDWCGGRSVDGHPAVQRLDGSDFVALANEGAVAPLPGGRFARITFDTKHPVVPDARMITGSVFWDLKTGRVGSAEGMWAGGHDGVTSYAVGGSYALRETESGYVLLDFNRVT
jgi:hypothetical protein